jgi:hypothetical protein
MGKYKYKLKETSSFSVGAGEQHATPFAFKKKYKLKEQDSPKSFHNERLLAFDRIYDLLGQINPLLKEAKSKTIQYYKQNPDTYNVLYSTDIIISYLEDILKTLRPNEKTNFTRTV